MHEAEKMIIGVAHDEIGSRLADTWNLPGIIRDIIAYHHKPGLCASYAKETEVVHLSDVIVKGLGISYRTDMFIPPFDGKGWAKLGLPEEDIGDIVGEIVEMMQDDILLKYAPGLEDGR
jgi:hypothetical protein